MCCVARDGAKMPIFSCVSGWLRSLSFNQIRMAVSDFNVALVNFHMNTLKNEEAKKKTKKNTISSPAFAKHVRK